MIRWTAWLEDCRPTIVKECEVQVYFVCLFSKLGKLRLVPVWGTCTIACSFRKIVDNFLEAAFDSRTGKGTVTGFNLHSNHEWWGENYYWPLATQHALGKDPVNVNIADSWISTCCPHEQKSEKVVSKTEFFSRNAGFFSKLFFLVWSLGLRV